MYKHILIATDGSDLARKALEQGLALAKALNAKVTAVTVTEPWGAVVPAEMVIAFPVKVYDENAAVAAAKILAVVADAANTAGVACEMHHAKDQFPAAGIIETAKERGCDLIVMASHGRRGLTRLLLGSQANKVVIQSPLPVLICR